MMNRAMGSTASSDVTSHDYIFSTTGFKLPILSTHCLRRVAHAKRRRLPDWKETALSATTNTTSTSLPTTITSARFAELRLRAAFEGFYGIT